MFKYIFNAYRWKTQSEETKWITLSFKTLTVRIRYHQKQVWIRFYKRVLINFTSAQLLPNSLPFHYPRISLIRASSILRFGYRRSFSVVTSAKSRLWFNQAIDQLNSQLWRSNREWNPTVHTGIRQCLSNSFCYLIKTYDKCFNNVYFSFQ